MKIIVLAEHSNGKFTKSSLEAVSYAAAWAKGTGGTCTAVTYGNIDASILGTYGANDVLKQDNLENPEAEQLAHLMFGVQQQIGANGLVVSHDNTGKAIAPRLSVKLNAALVPGATALPNGKEVKKNVFSGKAIAHVTMNTDVQIISVLPNSFGMTTDGSACGVSAVSVNVAPARVKLKEVRVEASEGIPLPEADLVVSAGRGMKGPENWGQVEELANLLGAATACSRPVSDIGWRPHHEHVGQTGLAIRPNLYIAIGISGAIQHLAGVNGSKVIVVINKDPEAPFFKAADYGIVGDAFEVLPKLIDAVKAYNATK